MEDLVFIVATESVDYYIDLFLEIKRSTRRPRTAEWYEAILGYYKSSTSHLPAWPLRGFPELYQQPQPDGPLPQQLLARVQRLYQLALQIQIY